KAVLDLALNYGQDLVTIHDIAKHIDAPIKFLEQVLLVLKKGGFVQSRRGKVGGYLLSRPPGQITAGEVIRFIDGPIEPISCIDKKYSNCLDLNHCVFKGMWYKVSKAISDIIDNVTFEDLVSQAGSSKQALAYSI
ncbi:MAG: Rrf2 family transcriptional regulator, partial [Candidatus Omnitrophica bacterium]|nr:Rrf2 family transcriptional regulator [Candidatus Omnitrophota bacterium]